MANNRASGAARAAGTQQPAQSQTLSRRSHGKPAAVTRSSRPAAVARGSARVAAGQVERKEHLVVQLPVLGELHLPHPQDLAYYGGVGVLVAVGLLEWPAALALGIGHALVSQHRSRALQELGDALDEA